MRFTAKARAQVGELLKENSGKILRVHFRGYG
jgi:hypothetical protein